MATNREVKLGIDVSTSGTDALKTLRDSVSALAKSGGDAAPQFQVLAEELDRVAQQQNTIDEFVTLKRTVVDLDAALTPVTQQVDLLGTQLTTAAEKTRLFAESQSTAKQSMAETKALVTSATTELAALKLEYQAGRVSVEDYKAQSTGLKTTIADLKIGLVDLVSGYKQASTEAKAAATDEKTLQAQYNQSVNSATQLSNALGVKNAALDASRATLSAVGVSTTSLIEAEAGVKGAFTAATTAVEQHLAAQQRSAISAKALAEAEAFLQSEIEIETASRRQAIAAEEQYLAAIQSSAAATRQAAAASATALNQAFAVTGVKSAQSVEAEIAVVNAALDKLAGNARVSGEAFDKAFASGQQKIAAIRSEAAGLAPALDKAGTSTGYLGQQFSQLAAIYGGIQLGQAFLDANTQAVSLTRSLTAVTGSSSLAASQIEVLHNVANIAGVSVGSISDSFKRFNASALAAGVPVGTVNQLFTALTVAGAKAGLSSDRVALSLDALAQIAGKGTVQMEELKGQLGDSLPGALKIAADSLGVTIPQLTKLVEAGQLTSDVFLNSFGPALEQAFGRGEKAVTGFSASFSRFKNTLSEFSTIAGEDAGVMKVLSGGLDLLSGGFRVINGAAKETIGALGFLGDAVKLTFAAISNIPSQGVSAAFDGLNASIGAANVRATAYAKGISIADAANQLLAQHLITTEAATKANAQAAADGGIAAQKAAEKVDQQTVSVQGLAKSSGEVGTAAASASSAVQGLATVQTEAVSAAETHAAALTSTATATTAVGLQSAAVTGQVATLIESFGRTSSTAALSATQFGKLEQALVANRGSMSAAQVASALLGTNVTQLGIAYTNLIAATEKDEAAATKNVQAKQNQGKALTQLIALTGEQAQIQAAALQSAQIQLVADQQLLTLNEKQVGLATAQKAAIESLAAATGTLTDQQKTQLTGLDLTIQKYTSEADKSREQVAVINSEIVARQLAVRTYGDQSAGLSDLETAYDLNVIALASIIEAQKRGLATDADVLAQRTRTVFAEGLYRDALNNTVEALARHSASAKADSDITVAGLNNRLNAAKVQEQVVRGLGDESAATASVIDQKRIGIDVVQANAKAQTDAANATIAGLREQLNSTLSLTAAQREDIATRIKIAEAQKIQALGSEIVVDGIEAEIAALARRNATVAAPLDGSTQRNVQTIDSIVAAEKKAQDATNHTGQDNTGLSSLQAKQKAGTLSAADLATAQAVFGAAAANLQTYQKNSNAFSAQGAQSVQTDFNSAKAILEKLTPVAAPAAAKAAAAVAPASVSAPTPAASTLVNQPITIQIGSASITKTIQFGSAADAQALIALLQTAASRTGA